MRVSAAASAAHAEWKPRGWPPGLGLQNYERIPTQLRGEPLHSKDFAE